VKSIIQNNKECYVCKTTLDLHKHHIFGASNRKHSERFGLTVFLCGYHHDLSDEGVHFRKDLDLHLKQLAQTRFEETYTESFIKVFGKNYK
jgi:hypothetical protein